MRCSTRGLSAGGLPAAGFGARSAAGAETSGAASFAGALVLMMSLTMRPPTCIEGMVTLGNTSFVISSKTGVFRGALGAGVLVFAKNGFFCEAKCASASGEMATISTPSSTSLLDKIMASEPILSRTILRASAEFAAVNFCGPIFN